MDNTDVLIIGAGLAGLSTAWHLDRPCRILEAEAEPGGKCRSITSGNSTYDFTGHLLHLRTPEIKALVERLLPDTFQEIERKAAIFTHDRFLPYPFQANFHQMPKQAVKDCLLGFIKAWKYYEKDATYDSLKDWALATFGQGICDHFFFPYNKKLFRTPSDRMSADWVSWSVPQPDIEAVVDGALGSEQRGLGYNATFLYPKQGGIEILPRTLAAGTKGIRYKQKVVEIDTVNKSVRTESGDQYSYEMLVNTAPLPELLSMITTPEPRLKNWREGLRWVNVFNLNVTLDVLPDWHWQWLYLPEDRFACYRIGVSSNISPALAPEGCCTVYTEFSYLPDEGFDIEATRNRIIDDLGLLGLLREGVSIVDETAVDLKHAYVVHDQFRAQHLDSILRWLKQRSIISTGRWGAWVYGGMEDALLQGYKVAAELNLDK